MQEQKFPWPSNKIRIRSLKMYRGNVREIENNNQAVKECLFFLSNLTKKELFYTFTINTVSFTTHKRLGLCCTWNNNNIVILTLVAHSKMKIVPHWFLEIFFRKFYPWPMLLRFKLVSNIKNFIIKNPCRPSFLLSLTN